MYCSFDLLKALINTAKNSPVAYSELKFSFKATPIIISCEFNGSIPFFQIQSGSDLPYEPTNSQIIKILDECYGV